MKMAKGPPNRSCMKIEKYQVVTSFNPNPEIVFSKVFPILKERLNGRLVNLNIPDNTPPETPRIVISSKDKILNVGLNRFDIHIQLPLEIRNESKTCLEYLHLTLDPILKTLIKELKITYTWSGLIANLKLPIEGKSPSSNLIKPLFERLLSIQVGNKKLSSFNLQFGLNESNNNRLYTVNAYESKNIQIPPLVAGQSLLLNMDDVPISESGLQIVLDINTRPNINKNGSALGDIKTLIKLHENYYDSILEDLNLKDVF